MHRVNPNADVKDTQMLLNHRNAIKHAIAEVRDRGSMELTAFNVRGLHAMLAHELMGVDRLGALRGSIPGVDPGIGVHQSSYRPSSNPAQIESAFATILQKASQIRNPYEASFFLLVHLPYLQPFHDCNKRTARMACNVPLLNAGITPISWMSSTLHTDGYRNGHLGVYELCDISLLADLYVENFMRSAEIFEIIRRERQPNKLATLYPDQLKAYIRQEILEGSAELPRLPSTDDAAAFFLYASGELDSIKVNPMMGVIYGLSPHAVSAWIEEQRSVEGSRGATQDFDRVVERER
jgi:hypothetical protein